MYSYSRLSRDMSVFIFSMGAVNLLLKYRSLLIVHGVRRTKVKKHQILWHLPDASIRLVDWYVNCIIFSDCVTSILSHFSS